MDIKIVIAVAVVLIVIIIAAGVYFIPEKEEYVTEKGISYLSGVGIAGQAYSDDNVSAIRLGKFMKEADVAEAARKLGLEGYSWHDINNFPATDNWYGVAFGVRTIGNRREQPTVTSGYLKKK